MRSLRDTGPSIWMATSGQTSYPPLAGDLSVDVAIIGGGITGLTTALLLVRERSTVALVEADRIGASTTGYTTAKLTSLHGLTYASIARDHGEEDARRYGEANEAAIKKVFELTTQSGIQCDLERMPAYTYAVDKRLVGEIEREVEVAQHLGLPASFATATDLPYEIAGAVRFDGQAMFHPRKYCLGLADLVTREGGRLFEMTSALGIDSDGVLATAIRQRAGSGPTMWCKRRRCRSSTPSASSPQTFRVTAKGLRFLPTFASPRNVPKRRRPHPVHPVLLRRAAALRDRRRGRPQSGKAE